jgi:hypothetical protein
MPVGQKISPEDVRTAQRSVEKVVLLSKNWEGVPAEIVLEPITSQAAHRKIRLLSKQVSKKSLIDQKNWEG